MKSFIDWYFKDSIKPVVSYLIFITLIYCGFYYLREKDKHLECVEALKADSVADAVRMQLCAVGR